MDLIFLILLSVFMILLGITNYRGNISSIHWYNRTKVSREDTPKYGKIMGIGTMIIGFSILISAILQEIFENELVWFISVGGIIIGLVFMLYAQFKYNKGIF